MITKDKPGTPKELVHFGTKGMKWGVRKERSSITPLKGLGPDKVVRKTKSGETLTLTKNPPNAMNKVWAKFSKNYRDSYNNSAFITIQGSDGKKIGSAQFWNKNKDDLYLNWIDINKSSRGKGYATASLLAARDWAIKDGKKRMILEVPGDAPDARHIYEKMGFKVTRELSKNDMWGGLTEMEYNFK